MNDGRAEAYFLIFFVKLYLKVSSNSIIMLFNKNDERKNERILYKTKPNMILGCKKAILGIILLAVVFVVSPMVIQFIGEMQVFLISQIQLPLTRYAAIGFFVVILIIILYIIWQLISWHSKEYVLTDTRIIVKYGVLSTKKNYMPYSAIQDINTSQSIFARLFNVGTVSVFSAYDNNLMKIENVSSPSKVEEIIFSNMMGMRNFQEPPRNFIDRTENIPYSDNVQYSSNTPYSENISYSDNSQYDDYYDEYEPITPIGHERSNPRREYEYYPEDFNFHQEQRVNKYEYEPYENEYDVGRGHVVNNSNENIRYEGAPKSFSNEPHYNERVDDSYANENNYQYDEVQINPDESTERIHQNEAKPAAADEASESSETVIRRHFDKFKK